MDRQIHVEACMKTGAILLGGLLLVLLLGEPVLGQT
jgi:hypothetical protein